MVGTSMVSILMGLNRIEKKQIKLGIYLKK